MHVNTSQTLEQRKCNQLQQITFKKGGAKQDFALPWLQQRHAVKLGLSMSCQRTKNDAI